VSVDGTAADTDVFQIANDSTLTGLDITGGNDDVFGDSVTGFTLRDINISGATQHGVFLDGTNSGDIRNVVSNLNGLNGFLVDFPGGNSAVFSNNSSTNNTLLVYNIISGTPFDGIMTNTGSGNGGGGDNF